MCNRKEYTGQPCLNGIGKAADNSWMEASFFVPGATKEMGIQWAEKYGQLAIVYGRVGRNSELVY